MSGEPLDLLAKIRGVYLVDEFENAVAMVEDSNYPVPSLVITFQRPEGWAGEEGDVRTSTCSYPDMSDTGDMPFCIHFHCFVHRFSFVVLLYLISSKLI
jgi:hypothetical protein